MTSYQIFLVLAASSFHAIWNAILRHKRGEISVIWSSLCVAVLLYAPLAFWFLLRANLGPAALEGIPYFLASAIIHAVYFYQIGRAYECGELSFVYPYSRAVGVLSSVLSGILILGESISFPCAIGIGLVVIGISALGHGASNTVYRHRTRVASIGILIGLASIIDKIGVTYIPPYLYIWFLFFFCSCIMLPWFVGQRWKRCREVFKSEPVAILAIGPSVVVTYCLLLEALRTGVLGQIAALREISLVFATLIGVFFFEEDRGKLKGFGICLIVFGLLLVTSQKI